MEAAVPLGCQPRSYIIPIDISRLTTGFSYPVLTNNLPRLDPPVSLGQGVLATRLIKVAPGRCNDQTSPLFIEHK